MNESRFVKLEMKGHVAWVTLNRPEKRNALNFDMLEQLIATFQQLDQDENVRVVVIKGEGKSFCASNLALLQANMGYRTLLVDADFHRIEVFRTGSRSKESVLPEHRRQAMPTDRW